MCSTPSRRWLGFGWYHSLPCPCCSEALLGTDSGAIYELSVDEGKKERLQKLHELHGEAGPIAGLAQVRVLAWLQDRAAASSGPSGSCAGGICLQWGFVS